MDEVGVKPGIEHLSDISVAGHEANLDAHIFSPGEKLRTGQYLAEILHSHYNLGTLALVADTLYAVPFVVYRDLTVDRIGVTVTGFDAGTNIRLGIYEDGTNIYPGALVLDAGVVSSASNALVVITISQALTKGLYHLALVSDGTPTIRVNQQGLTQLGGTTSAPQTNNDGWTVAFTYAALPNPFTAGGALFTTSRVSIWLRLASLD